MITRPISLHAFSYIMLQVAFIAGAAWCFYKQQWKEAIGLLMALLTLRFPPPKRNKLPIALFLCFFGVSACEWNHKVSFKPSAVTGPTEGVTLVTSNNTQIPNGTAGLWAKNSGGKPVLQGTDGTQWEAGEASSIKLGVCNTLPGSFGNLCADSARSEYYVYINGWKKLPQEDTLLLHKDGAETITGRKTFPGGLQAPIIPSIVSGTGIQVVGHVVPNVADDTFALLLATQSFRNKTIDASLNTLIGVASSTVQIIAGAGMTGGGDLSANRTLNVIAHADGSIVVNADNIQVGVITDSQHGSRSGGALHANAVASGAAGFMTGSDKAKLDGIAASATNTPLSSTLPADIGTSAIGVGTTAARADHVHDLPSVVAASSCTNCSITYDAKGRITAASNGSSGAVRKESAWYSGNAAVNPTLTDQFTFPDHGGFSATSTSMPWVPIRDGSFTGLSILCGQSTPVTAGSLTVQIWKSSSAVSGASVVLSSGQSATATFTAGTYSFTAGNPVELRFTTTNTYVGCGVAGFKLEWTE